MITIAYIAAGYLVLVWGMSRIIVPNLGFRKRALPDLLPENFAQILKRLDLESLDNLDFLQHSYAYIIAQYNGSRIQTITKFWRAYKNPLTQKPGFMHCTNQNYLLRLMLVKSGRFIESDIKVRIVPLNLFIHQYLEVRIGAQWIVVDPWSAFLKVPFGKHAFLFG